jgi:hypothetical protein
MDPEVTQARQKAEGLQQQAIDFGSKGITLADELRKAIGERYEGSPVVQDISTKRADFLSAGPQARSDVAGLVNQGEILSPSQQQAILAQKQASALVPLMGSNLTQQAMFGTLEDLIGAGTRAFQAQGAQTQGLAGLAQQSYQNILNEMLQSANLEQQRASEGRAAELHPLEKLRIQAQTAASNRSGVPKPTKTSLEHVMVGNEAYSFNPLTGKLEPSGVTKEEEEETLTTAELKRGVAEDTIAGYSEKELFQAYPELPQSSVSEIYDANKPDNWLQNLLKFGQ